MIEVWDSCLRFRFGIRVWDSFWYLNFNSCLELRLWIQVWESSLGFMFGIQFSDSVFFIQV